MRSVRGTASPLAFTARKKRRATLWGNPPFESVFAWIKVFLVLAHCILRTPVLGL
jgi:hypothetical protein